MATIADWTTKQLSDDLVWREEELALLKKQLLNSPVGSTQEKTLLRANVAMVYAHYEGFCKFALELYIDALDKLKLKRKDLKWPLATHSMGKLHNELLSKANQTEFFSHFLSEFDKHLEEVANYERPPKIANLWPDLLAEWLQKLNLDAKYVSEGYLTLETLVESRNQIAHGKKLMVSNRADLEKYSNAATLAMHEVAVGISDALEKKTYKRHSFVCTILGHSA